MSFTPLSRVRVTVDRADAAVVEAGDTFVVADSDGPSHSLVFAENLRGNRTVYTAPNGLQYHWTIRNSSLELITDEPVPVPSEPSEALREFQRRVAEGTIAKATQFSLSHGQAVAFLTSDLGIPADLIPGRMRTVSYLVTMQVPHTDDSATDREVGSARLREVEGVQTVERY